MPPPPPKKFSDIVALLDTGNINDVLTMDFAALVQECHEQGKAGKLVLTLTVDPQGLQKQQAQITAEHTIKHPKPPLAGSVLFVGDHGSLHRTDPFQQTAFTDTSQEAPNS